MRWLAATLVLLAASACLLAWVYLHGRDTSDWRPPEAQIAHADAASALAAFGGSDCSSAGCDAELLGRTSAERWLVRLTVRGRSQCVQIDLQTFAVSQRYGLSGIIPSSCALHARAPHAL